MGILGGSASGPVGVAAGAVTGLAGAVIELAGAVIELAGAVIELAGARGTTSGAFLRKNENILGVSTITPFYEVIYAKFTLRVIGQYLYGCWG
jgi:hypothetical protein